jgi:hypothetical protein
MNQKLLNLSEFILDPTKGDKRIDALMKFEKEFEDLEKIGLYVPDKNQTGIIVVPMSSYLDDI